MAAVCPVISELLSCRRDIHFSVSFTTRQPRTGEEDGVNYSFVSREEFERMIAASWKRADTCSGDSDDQITWPLSVTSTALVLRPKLAGVNYSFVSREEFERMIAAGELLEYAEYVGNYYGTRPIRFCVRHCSAWRMDWISWAAFITVSFTTR